MKKAILTVRYDATDQLLKDWEKMSNLELVEYFQDTPELISEMTPESFKVETINQKEK